MADGAMMVRGRKARMAAPRCLVRRVWYMAPSGSHRTGRDDLLGPAMPCFTVDADSADFFDDRVQVDLEGIGCKKKALAGTFVLM